MTFDKSTMRRNSFFMSGIEVKRGNMESVKYGQDMEFVTLNKSLLVLFDPRCDHIYPKENYVPHGTIR